MVGLEVLQTSFTYLWEGYNVVSTWCHGCSLNLGHYGTHELDWGAYTQEVAKFSMNRCRIVGNILHGGPGGVGNSFNRPMGTYE